jgi:hypothetical protein
MRYVMTILGILNRFMIAVVWGIIIVLGILTTLLVITAMSIAWGISTWAGLSLLGLTLLIVWMMFYVLKH